MWIKICANTNLDDAALTAELGADAVGFVFAPSKRRVTAEQVAAITKHLPDGVEKVGVFHSDDADGITAAAQEAGLTAVQLHGEMRPALVAALNDVFEGHVKVIQTVRCEIGAVDAHFETALEAALSNPGVFAVLLDAAEAGVSGGLGVAFDWERVAPVVRAVVARVNASRGADDLPKLIVAGGLRPENVAEAIAAFAPWGVDVASGVEDSPGVKDPERLRAFLGNARAAGDKIGK